MGGVSFCTHSLYAPVLSKGIMDSCVMDPFLSVLGAQDCSLPGELQACQQVGSHCQEEQRSEYVGQPTDCGDVWVNFSV